MAPNLKAEGMDPAHTSTSKADAAEAGTTDLELTTAKMEDMQTDSSDVDAVGGDTAETSATEGNDEEESDNESDTDSCIPDDIPTTCPYVVGQTIQLQMDEEHSTDAKIVKVFEPFTLSCVMVIQLDAPSLKGEFVLKLYDRRFSTQLRDDWKFPWTPNLESEYHEFVNSGCVKGFFDFCDDGYSEDWWWGDSYPRMSKWSKPQFEGYLQYTCRRTNRIEREAYDTIRDLQGKHVPRLFAEPWLQLSEEPNEYLDCPGILLEYIKGYELTDILDNAPEKDWQYICDEAIQIIQLICMRGVLNKDIKTRSFTIHQDSDMKKPKLYMMDFGQCIFRHQLESVADFREMQANENEEGGIGFSMQDFLQGGFEYVESSWSCDLCEDFLRE